MLHYSKLFIDGCITRQDLRAVVETLEIEIPSGRRQDNTDLPEQKTMEFIDETTLDDN